MWLTEMSLQALILSVSNKYHIPLQSRVNVRHGGKIPLVVRANLSCSFLACPTTSALKCTAAPLLVVVFDPENQ